MLAKIKSAAILGMDAYGVDVEVDVSWGAMPKFRIVGLPSASVKESMDRVKTAINNCDFSFPNKKIVVNLAPADTKKDSCAFDLPIAVGILAATGDIKPDKLSQFIFVGELSLDGMLRKGNGILQAALLARELGYSGVIIPKDNAAEAALVSEIGCYPFETLQEVIRFLNNEYEAQSFQLNNISDSFKPPEYEVDFSDAKGQEHVKRALEIAAAGGHNLIMVGPPGSGKTMLSRRLPTILPELSMEEALSITKIYSVLGLVPKDISLIKTRPFRSPHHTTSDVALIGGGSIPKPGEVSLAHCGVLFLDELPEFKRTVLEVLRQPLEDGVVTISRAAGAPSFPAKFMLVAAMNPCPCGWYGDYLRECVCTATQIQNYIKKISGPLLDRIDIHIEVPRLEQTKLTNTNLSGESSMEIRKRTNIAREKQIKRYKKFGILNNSQLTSKLIKKFCSLDIECEELLKSAIREFGFTARTYDRIKKVARTIADLSEREEITVTDISEAIQLRTLDRKYWN